MLTSSKLKLTKRPVWRKIVKKNEKQGKGFFDVLICKHAVPADPENTYRVARSCPHCADIVHQERLRRGLS